MQDESDPLLHVSAKLPPGLLVRFELLETRQYNARTDRDELMKIIWEHVNEEAISQN